MGLGFRALGFRGLGFRGFGFRALGLWVYGITCSRKTYLFRQLYIETIIRNPKKVAQWLRSVVHFRLFGREVQK